MKAIEEEATPTEMRAYLLAFGPYATSYYEQLTPVQLKKEYEAFLQRA